ncbi:MAG: aminotransferase class V-fold PLP-dependent enzyme [Actinomycetes bacterium]
MSQIRQNAPLLDAYLAYFEASRRPFTIPGHKQATSKIDGDLGRVVDSDVPLYGGLDEIKLTNHTLIEAESLAAQLWGGDWARFSTGGSTHANQAVILALGKPGDKVALSRTAHRSVLSALILAGLEPIWLTPEIDSATGVPTGIPISELQRALRDNPIALLLTEPGYLGTLSDISALVTLAHENSIPVIVDAAWGGHFGFHPELPDHVMHLGADALITSVHKALPGYSASALLVARTTYLNRDRLEQGFETTHTTSPAGAPLASIDGVRALLQLRGEELIGLLLENVARFKAQVQENFTQPVFLNASDFAPGRFDPTKVVLRANQLGCSGIEIERRLIEKNIRVEMADRDTVVFLITLADDQFALDGLVRALTPILLELEGEPRPSATALSWSVQPQVGISMRDAYFSSTETVPADQAVGRISADLIAPYPPGVAVLAPGEIITAHILDGLVTAKNAGVRIAYASDASLATFRVTSQ